MRSLHFPFEMQTSSQLYRQLKACGNSTSYKCLLCCTPADKIGTASTFITYMYNMKERQKNKINELDMRKKFGKLLSPKNKSAISVAN